MTKQSSSEISGQRVRVHGFSVSLDGFGTGVGLTYDEPFGHAGHRLHEWMIATRFGRPIVGLEGGSDGVDNAFAQQHTRGPPSKW